MVDGQIRTFDVTDQRVIKVFDDVRRDMFLPDDLKSFAYSDAALKVKLGSDKGCRVMLRPMHLARMLQGADVQPGNRVLVVAGEGGYGAALLAALASQVVSLESSEDLSRAAASRFEHLGLVKVQAVTGALDRGHADAGPYDVILVQGAVETNLKTLLGQLAPGGRLLAIEIGTQETSRRSGRAVRFERLAGDVGMRVLFDATAPVLPEFRAVAEFVF
jgi:protein-L-isoaspartate(D-aspartate) O-methyltransferase